MATFAVPGEIPLVIIGVAGSAGGRYLGEICRIMAGFARDFLVDTVKREPGYVVIEFYAFPGRGIMAVRAFAIHYLMRALDSAR